MSRYLYTDIAEVTTLVSSDILDIIHAEDGDPGTGTIRGTFPDGAFYQDSIDLFVEAAAAFGISVTADDSDGATVILHLDWRNGISRDRAEEIIAEEGMDAASVGYGACLILKENGDLSDCGTPDANLTSEAAFRAQVIEWREASGLPAPTQPVTHKSSTVGDTMTLHDTMIAARAEMERAVKAYAADPCPATRSAAERAIAAEVNATSLYGRFVSGSAMPPMIVAEEA